MSCECDVTPIHALSRHIEMEHLFFYFQTFKLQIYCN